MTEEKERTLLVIKPDAVQRKLIGKIITRIEEKGLDIIGLKMLQLDSELVDRLYDIHVGKGFYSRLKNFMLSGPIVALAIEGSMAVSVIRKLCGATKSYESPPGTIRGDYGLSYTKNIVHASDQPERAKYELSVLFSEQELINNFTSCMSEWFD